MPDNGSWHDLRSFDLLIAIRSFDRRRYTGKPPSKLVNAWLAGVPFIGGADAAYGQVGTLGEDYLRATSPDEVIAAVRRLRDEPGLRDRLIRAGRTRAAAFAVPAIVERWREVLTGPVLAGFHRHQRNPRRQWARTSMLWRIDAVRVRARRFARVALHRVRG